MSTGILHACVSDQLYTGVTGGSELPCECWELNPGSARAAGGFIHWASSLAHPAHGLYLCILHTQKESWGWTKAFVNMRQAFSIHSATDQS